MILGINSDGKKLSSLDGLYEIKVPETVGQSSSNTLGYSGDEVGYGSDVVGYNQSN